MRSGVASGRKEDAAAGARSDVPRLFLWLALFLAPTGAFAQQNVPHIGYAYPAGGRQGTTVEVKIGGQFIQGTTGAYISGSGVKATVESVWRPLTQREVQDLTQKIQDAQKKLNLPRNAPGSMAKIMQEAGLTDKQVADLQEFRKNRQDPKRQLNPQIEEIVTLQVQIDPQAAPGLRSLRLMTPAGLTTPIRFVVGQLPEVAKVEEADAAVPGLGRRVAANQQFAESAEPAPQEIDTPLPVILNGQILPGAVDRYSFEAKKGERIVAEAAARDLMPYLADTVPGWFQVALTLRDAKGEEIAYADHRMFDPSPVLACVIPSDGTYTLDVRDALYRGREDFVYRITLGQIPYVTSIFPLGTRVDVPAVVKLTGWNLPASQVSVNASAEPGIELVSSGASNKASFKVDALPEISEAAAKSHGIVLPVVVDGRVDRPGDVDVFHFKGQAGQKIVAEVFARRLGSPLDSVLELTDAKGKRIAFNDDFDDQGFGLVTYQADSYLAATLPSAGVYYLKLRDTTGKGGPEYGYRLRVSEPRPDFELRTVPSTINVRAGTTTALTVYALRRDGYAGPIDLALQNPPAEFSLSGGIIPAGADHIRLTLTGSSAPTADPVAIQIVGSAQIGRAEVKHLAVPADDMMQAFAYRHWVPADDELVAVIGRPNRAIPWLAQNQQVKLSLGSATPVRLGGPAGPMASRIHFTLEDAPDGFALQGVAVGPGGLTATIKLDPKKVKAGAVGNLILGAYIDQEVTPPKGGAARTRRVSLGYVPAIPFEVVAG